MIPFRKKPSEPADDDDNDDRLLRRMEEIQGPARPSSMDAPRTPAESPPPPPNPGSSAAHRVDVPVVPSISDDWPEPSSLSVSISGAATPPPYGNDTAQLSFNRPKAQNDTIIAIDLGTTNSVVAILEGSTAKVIRNAFGQPLTPSVVAITQEGEVLIGEPARRQAAMNPYRTISSIKRFMGRRYSELSDEEKQVSFELKADASGYVRVKIGDRDYSPSEISAWILRNLKKAAEAYLGYSVRRAVITVPAYFNDAQRQATKDAGQIAGLEVERIINEPTAAALAYGSGKTKRQKIAVFDLGGGTFDVSVLRLAQGVFDVISTNGDTHLGGDDFDNALMRFVAGEFKQKSGIDLLAEAGAKRRLKEACEDAKKQLSEVSSTEIYLPFVATIDGQPKHLQVTVTRGQLEHLIEPIVRRVVDPVRQALSDAKLKASDVDEVVLVGGSTRVPLVQTVVEEIFGRKPNKGVNPDEVVATGATLQGGVISGSVGNIVLLDVTPLSLGVETLGSIMVKLIERNTHVPTERKQIFTTVDDYQSTVTVRVFQGERELTAGNRLLCEFTLDGIPPQPKGTPKIEVKFDIDANGILQVSATDLGTGRAQSVRIEQACGLSRGEIEKLRDEADKNATEDHHRREMIEVRSLSEIARRDIERLLAQHGTKLSADSRGRVQSVLKQLDLALGLEQPQTIRSAIREVEQGTQQLLRAICESVSDDLKQNLMPNVEASRRADAKSESSLIGLERLKVDLQDWDPNPQQAQQAPAPNAFRHQAEIACGAAERWIRDVADQLPPRGREAIESAIHDVRSLIPTNRQGDLQQAVQELESVEGIWKEVVRSLQSTFVAGRHQKTPSPSSPSESISGSISGSIPTGNSGSGLGSGSMASRDTKIRKSNSSSSRSGVGGLDPGTQIRDYKLLERIGQGGMGTVFKALHTQLDKTVAVKVMLHERLNSEEAVERFKREMRAVGKLDHPNIVRATDAGQFEGTHYLVMELIDGVDLARLIERDRTFGVPDACEIIRQAALGLQHAHEHNLVHRDVKPSNLLLARNGTVKVLDLGLALLNVDVPVSRELTMSGLAIGTVDYMAPEQASDTRRVDIRADIYSLGCALYEFLCGEPPFAAPRFVTPLNKVMAHANTPVIPASSRRFDIPQGLSQLVDRMLSKSAAERPPTPRDVALELVPFCEGADLAALIGHYSR